MDSQAKEVELSVLGLGKGMLISFNLILTEEGQGRSRIVLE